MSDLWHMRCDGEYVYSVFCPEEDLQYQQRAFLLAVHPMNEPVTVDITFERVDLDEDRSRLRDGLEAQ